MVPVGVVGHGGDAEGGLGQAEALLLLLLLLVHLVALQQVLVVLVVVVSKQKNTILISCSTSKKFTNLLRVAKVQIAPF